MRNVMTVGELREILEDFEGWMEVKIVHQENYPLVSSVRSVVSTDEVCDAVGETDEAEGEELDRPKTPYVLIVEGWTIDYGNRVDSLAFRYGGDR